MTDKSYAIRVQLFAGAAALADAREIYVELPCNSPDDDRTWSIGCLRKCLLEQYPQLDALTSMSRFALGTEFADDETRIDLTSMLAMIPPVSGG